MEVYIYHDRQLAGIVESIEYLKWTRRYSRAGSFVLKAAGTPENMELLRVGNYIWKNDDVELGMIEHLEITQTNKEMITVSGRFATALLDRRIILGTETLYCDVSVGIGQIITNHIINPSDTARRINNLSFTAPHLGFHINQQFSYKNVLDVVTGLCEAADVGIRTIFSPNTGLLTVTLYRGAPSQAVFSRQYENLISQTYIHNVSDHRDSVVVAGEGEGAERVLAVINGASGEERRELYVDARDLRKDDYDDYPAALLFRGQTKLAEHSIIQNFDAEINSRGNLRYKVDYDLGDIVTIQARPWGVMLQTRISEITESYDQTGLSIDAVFGKGIITISQRLQGVNK